MQWQVPSSPFKTTSVVDSMAQLHFKIGGRDPETGYRIQNMHEDVVIESG